MSNTAYWLEGLAKKSLLLSEEEWQSVLAILSDKGGDALPLYFKMVEVKVQVQLLRNSLEFKEEAKEVAGTMKNFTNEDAAWFAGIKDIDEKGK